MIHLFESGLSLIHTIIPISGAAVQTNFFLKLIQELHKKSARFIFHIVVKNAPFTRSFIDQASSFNFVHLYVGTSDRKVIENYEYVYQKNTISLEITKPSEQAFKALIDPKKSGSILLFSNPVGRQEEDNLDFLRRHKLIPSLSEQKILYKMKEDEKLLKKASSWRGILLPQHSLNASNFIYWCLKKGVFQSMLNYKMPNHENNLKDEDELNPNGVFIFWKKVAKILE